MTDRERRRLTRMLQEFAEYREGGSVVSTAPRVPQPRGKRRAAPASSDAWKRYECRSDYLPAPLTLRMTPSVGVPAASSRWASMLTPPPRKAGKPKPFPVSVSSQELLHLSFRRVFLRTPVRDVFRYAIDDCEARTPKGMGTGRVVVDLKSDGTQALHAGRILASPTRMTPFLKTVVIYDANCGEQDAGFLFHIVPDKHKRLTDVLLGLSAKMGIGVKSVYDRKLRKLRHVGEFEDGGKYLASELVTHRLKRANIRPPSRNILNFLEDGVDPGIM